MKRILCLGIFLANSAGASVGQLATEATLTDWFMKLRAALTKSIEENTKAFREECKRANLWLPDSKEFKEAEKKQESLFDAARKSFEASIEYNDYWLETRPKMCYVGNLISFWARKIEELGKKDDEVKKLIDIANKTDVGYRDRAIVALYYIDKLGKEANRDVNKDLFRAWVIRDKDKKYTSFKGAGIWELGERKFNFLTDLLQDLTTPGGLVYEFSKKKVGLKPFFENLVTFVKHTVEVAPEMVNEEVKYKIKDSASGEWKEKKNSLAQFLLRLAAGREFEGETPMLQSIRDELKEIVLPVVEASTRKEELKKIIEEIPEEKRFRSYDTLLETVKTEIELDNRMKQEKVSEKDPEKLKETRSKIRRELKESEELPKQGQEPKRLIIPKQGTESSITESEEAIRNLAIALKTIATP